MRILLVNAFHVTSHQRWADSLVRYSRHEIDLVTLPGRHWKWRMHGAAVQLALKLPAPDAYDVLLVTDMLDLATLRGLRPELAKLRTILFFHENQITYPWSPTDEDVKRQRDQRYGWINYTSALAADELWFNSAYHQRVWHTALPGFLHKFPEGKNLPIPMASQQVLPHPVEGLKKLATATRPSTTGPPTILWNHRWEYDKGPNLFFETLTQLKQEGYAFRLIVLGESYARAPAVFAKAKEVFADEILHWGFAPDRETYECWLLKSDILLVTSKHDFFGISVVEAIAAGAIPVLPKGLAYQEHLDTESWNMAHYSSPKECLTKLKTIVNGEHQDFRDRIRLHVTKYDAELSIDTYDRLF